MIYIVSQRAPDLFRHSFLFITYDNYYCNLGGFGMATFGYKESQRENWYMKRRVPSNSNYSPIHYDALSYKHDLEAMKWTPLAVVGDIFYETRKMNRYTYLYAVDRMNRSDITGDRIAENNNFVAHDNGFYYSNEGTIVSSQVSGREIKNLWTSDMGGFEVRKINYDDKQVYVSYQTKTGEIGRETSYIAALDAVTGLRKWEYKVGVTSGTVNIVIGDDKIFLSWPNYSASASQVIAIDAASGKELWIKDYSLDDLFEYDIFMVYSDHVLYNSVKKNMGTEINGIDTKTGKVIWTHAAESPIYDPFGEAFSVNNKLLTYNTSPNLIALDKHTGAMLWSVDFTKIKPEYTSWGFGNIVLTNNLVITMFNYSLLAFDSSTGKLVKEWVLEDFGGAGRISIVASDMIVLMNSGYKYYMLKPIINPKKEYIAKAGDTLSGVASMFHTGTQYLMKLNNVSDTIALYPGQKLWVPDFSDRDYLLHTVKPGDNLFRLALFYGSNVKKIGEINNLKDVNKIYVGQLLKIPEVILHTVQPNDTLWKISQLYQVPIAALIANNNLVPPYLIYVGQKLLIE
jgi:LysM repeat protein/outer membrane protein assembly factor BamB